VVQYGLTGGKQYEPNVSVRLEPPHGSQSRKVRLMSSKFRGHVSGVKYVGTRNMMLKEIVYDFRQNKQRSADGGEKAAHKAQLVNSFEEHGILEDRPKIVVEDRNGKTYLLDGYNRFAAMETWKGLGLALEVDVVICADQTAREDLQISANICLPQHEASQKSIVNTITEQIERGDLANNQASVKHKVNALCKGKPKTWKDQVVHSVMSGAGTVVNWQNWSDSQSTTWLTAKHGRTTNFNYDPNRNCYGAVMKQESEYRTIMRACEKFAETGIPTEVVIAVLEKGNLNLHEKRESVIDTTNKWLDALMNVCGVKEFPNGYPLTFVGCLPQDFTVEHNECLIPIDPDTDEIGKQPKP
jgi:hypothetical protein